MTRKKKQAKDEAAQKVKQRGNGQGSVYRYRGRWRWQLRGEVNGTTKVIASGLEDTRGAAEKALAKAIADKDRGQLAASSSVTLGDWLDTWLLLRKPHVRATTYEQYEWRLRRHVPDHLKKLRLQAIKRGHLLSLEAELAHHLAASTRKKVIEHLAAAFKEAMHQDLLMKNPADDIQVAATAAERAKTKRRKALTDDELSRFLGAAADDRLYPVFYLMFSLGVRCSEALGLRWQDVDFFARSVRIEQANVMLKSKPIISDPKTINSRRLLPASHDLLQVLMEQRAVQDRQRRELGAAWPETDLVFTTARGSLLDRHNVQRTIDRLCERAGIEKFGTHSGRHTNITNRLRARQLPEVVAKIAGHARVSTTLNIYRRVMPDEIRAAEFDLSAHLTRLEAAD